MRRRSAAWSLALVVLGVFAPACADPARAALAALGDADPARRADAAVRLGRLGGDDALAALVAALDDADPGVRAAAAQALGELGDGRAVVALVAHLEPSSAPVLAAQLSALAGFGEGALGPARERLERDAALRRELPPRAAAAPEPWRALWRHLLRPGERAGLKAAALLALAAIGDADSVPLVREQLREPAEVRLRALRALATIGGDEAWSALVDALDTPDALDRAQVEDALCGAGARARGPLVEALAAHRSEQVRGRAAVLLGELGGAEALDALLAADWSGPELGAALLTALAGTPAAADARLTERLAGALEDGTSAERLGVLEALLADEGLVRGREARLVAALDACLGDADVGVRFRSVDVLGRCGDDGARTRLAELADDPGQPEGLRRRAERVLERAGER